MWFCHSPSVYGCRRREAAEVQHRPPELRHLRDLTLGQEPVGDASLVEDLDRA